MPSDRSTASPSPCLKRTAFFVSDSTGITAEHLGNSLLAQFDNVEFTKITLPFVNSPEAANKTVAKINASFEKDGAVPIIFDTIVNQDIRQILSTSNGFMIDVFGTFVAPLEKELGTMSSYRVGSSRSVVDDQRYTARMEAVQFAMENDDGGRINYYDRADVIIIGVSRSGKTPTCIYLALQYGVRAANYPLTEEDLEESVLPKILRPYKHKLFGLTIEPDRLANIRNERRANSRYASLAQCDMEVSAVEALFRKEHIASLNSTHLSVEEISTRLIAGGYIQRRI